MSAPLIPDGYGQVLLDGISEILLAQAEMMRMFPLKASSPAEKERRRLLYAWMEKREAEAYALAPWLKEQVERDDW